MAKVIAPFQIVGTIDNFNFVVTADGNNYIRAKGISKLTSKEFNRNSKYDAIRNHGLEFGQCAKKSVVFRQLAQQFNDRAKDGSYAGRVNKILLEILQEDQSQPKGKRSIIAALDNGNNVAEILLNFESNKLRPLTTSLKAAYNYDTTNSTLEIKKFNPIQDLDWPLEATHVHLAVAISNWDYRNDLFSTSYSEESILEKSAIVQDLKLSTVKISDSTVQITFLFIGFAQQVRRKYKMLHRKFNTATIIFVSQNS